jgi:hypothetical protein
LWALNDEGLLDALNSGLASREKRAGACLCLNKLIEVEPMFGLLFLARGGMRWALAACDDAEARPNEVSDVWYWVERACSLVCSYEGRLDGAGSERGAVERLAASGVDESLLIEVVWKAVGMTSARVAGAMFGAISEMLTVSNVWEVGGVLEQRMSSWCGDHWSDVGFLRGVRAMSEAGWMPSRDLVERVLEAIGRAQEDRECPTTRYLRAAANVLLEFCRTMEWFATRLAMEGWWSWFRDVLSEGRVSVRARGCELELWVWSAMSAAEGGETGVNLSLLERAVECLSQVRGLRLAWLVERLVVLLESSTGLGWALAFADLGGLGTVEGAAGVFELDADDESQEACASCRRLLACVSGQLESTAAGMAGGR